jgi:glycosyltransferase involved in cell wall biosynthesis
LAEKIARILDDAELARRLGSAGRARAAELFSVERNCDALLGLYADVLGRSSSTAGDASASEDVR